MCEMTEEKQIEQERQAEFRDDRMDLIASIIFAFIVSVSFFIPLLLSAMGVSSFIQFLWIILSAMIGTDVLIIKIAFMKWRKIKKKRDNKIDDKNGRN